jgi:hypothetical protein
MIISKQQIPLPSLDVFFRKHKCTLEEQRQLRALLLALRLGQVDLTILITIINKYNMNNNPRRHYLDMMHPAEKAIHDAVMAIEVMGADVELTNAQVLLHQAKDKVSDYLDKQPTQP